MGEWDEPTVHDTVVGCAVALISTYLLWPGDRGAKEAVPMVSTTPAEASRG